MKNRISKTPVLAAAVIIGLSAMLFSCTHKSPAEWAKEKAPEQFKARFETTKGNFEIESKREWSPLAVDRLYQLIQSGFYDGAAIFRVVPGFVVQFGITNDSSLNNFWNSRGFEDEPVIRQNTKGTVAFARGGPQSRTTQIFINLGSNSPKLDTIHYSGVTGFPGIAEVSSGINTVESFYGEYGDKLGYKQDSIEQKGYDFLARKYPKVDYILRAYILKEKSCQVHTGISTWQNAKPSFQN